MEAVIESPNETSGAESPSRSLGGKYLTFKLDSEEYGVEILKIREIIGIMDITQGPQASEFLQGVVNLRGKVIPVVDLRAKFGLSRAEYDDQTCIIVVDVGALMGIIVDTVREVYDVADEDVEPPPQLGSSVDTTFILGMARSTERVTILLDIEEVLNADEFVVPLDGLDT